MVGARPPALQARLRQLPLRRQYAMAELMGGSITTHSLYLTRDANRIAPYGDAHYIPFFYHEPLDGATLAQVFASNKGQPFLLQHQHSGIALKVNPGRYGPQILRLIDGKRSFDQNCAQFGADTRTDAETAFLFEHVPELACGADATCNAACGQGALPVDPDCGCDADHPCPDGNTCFNDRCIVDPFAPSGVGSECVDGNSCQSGNCASVGGEQLCVIDCTPGAEGACPDGFTCRDTNGGGGACWPADDGGCCSTGQGGATTSFLGIAAVALGLRRRRRATR